MRSILTCVATASRLRVGLMHKPIGVGPKLCLSAVRVLRDLLITPLRAFARMHQTFHVTPAMEAGIADHAWNLERNRRGGV
jgi:hypothetical protein